MATKAEITEQIEFGLSRLNGDNGQHEFEHLCRHYARIRITSNVAPATGPVGTGGDQGRDFETFPTGAENWFLSVTPSSSGNAAYAFACSIQQSNVPGKIARDVEKIMGTGNQPERVYFFTNQEVPVAERHRIQEQVQTSHGVHLIVIDRKLLAEELSERPLFWIAVQYLRIPSELYPPGIEEDESSLYLSLKTEWESRSVADATVYDFTQIKGAAREALYSTAFCNDVPFWLALLEKLSIGIALPQPMRREAVYEYLVVSFRFKRTFEGCGEALEGYFGGIAQWMEPEDLHNAATLLGFVIGAASMSASETLTDFSSARRKELLSRTDELLHIDRSSGSRCVLLETMASLQFQPDLRSAQPPDLAAVFHTWEFLVDEAASGPLYPVEEFARAFTKIIAMLDLNDAHMTSAYDRVADKLDKVIAARTGEVAAGKQSLARAAEFRKRGNLVRCVQELHRAKLRLFTHETLRVSLISLLLLGEAYEELGLPLAAKYFALAAAHAALHTNQDENRDLISKGLALAAILEHQDGAYCTALVFGFVALQFHGLMCPDPGELDRHPTVQQLLIRLAHVVSLLRPLSTKLSITTYLDQGELKPLIDNLSATMNASNGGPYRPATFDFCDAGKRRQHHFKALGIKWECEWVNDWTASPTAEAFIAFLQIFLTDADRFFVEPADGTVVLSISAAAQPALLAVTIESDTLIRVEVGLPIMAKGAPEPEMLATHLYLGAQLLANVSMIPAQAIISAAMKDEYVADLISRTSVGAPYARIWSEFLSEEMFAAADRLAISTLIPTDTEEKRVRSCDTNPAEAAVTSSNASTSARGFSTKSRFNVIDIDAWNSAKWGGMVYLLPQHPDDPVFLGFAFSDYAHGRKAFLQLRNATGELDAHKIIRISMIEDRGQHDYCVTIGVHLDGLLSKAAADEIKPDFTYFVASTRWQSMPVSASFQQFRALVKSGKTVIIVPAEQRADVRGIEIGWDLKVMVSGILFREIGDIPQAGDPDSVIL